MAGVSYLETSAAPAPMRSALRGHARADVCVVGGGLTGLSAALALARDGRRVTLLEAGTVGSGATGRSGGQLIPGFRQGACALVARFGRERARRLFDLTLAARTRTVELGRTGACDLRETGHVTAAAFANDLDGMGDEVRTLEEDFGYRDAVLLDRQALRNHVAANRFHGGVRDARGGHLHPLSYARALAAAAERAGVVLHEHTPVNEVRAGPNPCVVAAGGQVTAEQVVLACDARIGEVAVFGRPSPMRRRLMPVGSYTIATAPLAAVEAAALLPTNAAVSDTRFALDYFRLSADHRLLFSGGERYTLTPPRDIVGLVRRRLAHVFPSLARTPIDFAWAGLVAVTMSRFPDVGRSGALWWAHGYSGHGLLLAQAAGHAVAEAILGRADDFDLLASLPTGDWPGGAPLRRPLYTAGMLWFALKDRLK